MSSNTTWRGPLLVMALGLAAQAGAQTAPAASAPSQTKPSLKTAAASPGSGMAANTSVRDGSGGAGGSQQCIEVLDTVECSGPSSGSGDGPGWYGGGGLPNEYPMGKPPTGGTSGSPAGGTPPSDDKEKAKERARALCHSNYEEDLVHIRDEFNASVQQHCGNLAQLKIGFKVGTVEVELDRIGSVIEEMGRAFGRTCISIASDTRNGAIAQKREIRKQCLADAEKG